MKILQCVKCGKKQPSGSFCPDCGSPLKETITTEVKFKPINTKRTSDQLKRDIRTWLSRLGVQPVDIKIASEGTTVRLEYPLSNSLYSFSSHLQDQFVKNLAAVEQFLHYRVLSIERGIETLEKAFAGYEALPDYSDEKKLDPYEVLGFNQPVVTLEEAKARFKMLAKKYHPDVDDTKIAKEEFTRIRKAIQKIEEKEQ